MAKVATPRTASAQRTRSRTNLSETSESDTRATPDTFSFDERDDQERSAGPIYHCTLGCSKYFMREADLRRHQRTSKQHNSKAYYCGCGRSFTRMDAIKRHSMSFGHEVPASVLRGIPDDGPPKPSSAAVTPVTATGATAGASDDPSAADGIALLMAAAASLNSVSGPVTASETSDTYSSDGEDEDDTGDFTSSSASSSQFLTKPPEVDRTPVSESATSRKRKFTIDDDASSIDLASSWSSESFAVPISSSPAESTSSLRRTHAEPVPIIRRSSTFDMNENILTLAAVTIEASGRPLNRTKRSRSLLDATLDFPVSHASRLESRSESSAAFIMASPMHAQYA